MDHRVLSLFEIPGHALIVGKTKSGKSYLCRWLLKNLWMARKFASGGIISMTSSMTGEWDCIPKQYHIHPDATKKYMQLLMDQQRQLVSQGIKRNIFLVIDDAIGMIDWSDRFYIQFMGTARQYYISVFIIVQYMVRVHPSIRAQTDNIFYMRMCSERELANAYNQSFSLNFKYEEFKAFLRANTEGSYKAIRHHNSSTSNQADRIFCILQAPSQEVPFYMNF